MNYLQFLIEGYQHCHRDDKAPGMTHVTPFVSLLHFHFQDLNFRQL